MGVEMMKNFTSIEILPCNSKSIVLLLAVFTIYPSKRHSYFEKIDVNHFRLYWSKEYQSSWVLQEGFYS